VRLLDVNADGFMDVVIGAAAVLIIFSALSLLGMTSVIVP